MKFTKEMIQDYANKLLIGLTKNEEDLILKEFEVIDLEMDIIAKYPNIRDVEPMTHALDDFNITLRDDVAEESSTIDEIMANCDSYEDREIKVPKVVG